MSSLWNSGRATLVVLLAGIVLALASCIAENSTSDTSRNAAEFLKTSQMMFYGLVNHIIKLLAGTCREQVSFYHNTLEQSGREYDVFNSQVAYQRVCETSGGYHIDSCLADPPYGFLELGCAGRVDDTAGSATCGHAAASGHVHIRLDSHCHSMEHLF